VPELRGLDLGAGLSPEPGFVALDRYPLPGIHVVADLERALPFRSDAFDLVLAHHSLEHVRDLLPVLREIWRVARPGARVCIAAPYHSLRLNLANPHHHQAFNEHSPRFWTDAATSGVDPAEYVQPPLGARWGLARSDNSDPGFDLRCTAIRFHYLRPWRWLPARLRRVARRHLLDVCEQIVYDLVVWKPPMREDDAAITVSAYPFSRIEGFLRSRGARLPVARSSR
jgi:SAM-dependent methyltransferase